MRRWWTFDSDREPPYAMFLGVMWVLMGAFPLGILATKPDAELWLMRLLFSLGLFGAGSLLFVWGYCSATRRALVSTAVWFTAMAVLAPLMSIQESDSVAIAMQRVSVGFVVATLCVVARVWWIDTKKS